MTKKLLFGLMSASMLFATSCTNEVDFEGQNGGEAMVSFQVSTPEMVTRAYSDGTTATHLQYAVYKNGEILNDLTVLNGKIQGSTTVNLKLTTNHTYSVVFWAAAEDAPYSLDLENKKMTVDYTDSKTLSNDESRDAFYAYKTFTVKGAQTETIELKRPFAQLNIGTADYEDARKAGFAPTQSYVKVPVYSTLSFENGKVDGLQTVTFNYADIDKTQAFPTGDQYQYMAMNYLLVDAEKDVVDVEFGCKEENGAEETRVIGSVPVQRNYRTNIYGNILTSEVDVNVEIKPEYNEPALESQELFNVAAFGGEITLNEDVELTSPLIIQANVILNLNGKTLKGGKVDSPEMTGTDISAITVENGASLTILGEGTIEGTEYGVYVKNGTLTVEKANIQAGTSAVQVYNGTANIEGGLYACTREDNQYVINCIDAAWKNGNAHVNITGGTFVGFNPANNAAEGAGTNFVAEGYISIIDGEWCEVMRGVVVENNTNFEAALANAEIEAIELNGDISYSSSEAISIEKNVVIQAEGQTITAGAAKSLTPSIAVQGEYNVSINNANVVGGFIGAYYGANVVFNGGSLTYTEMQSGRNCFYAASTNEKKSVITIKDADVNMAKANGNTYICAHGNAIVYVEGGNFYGKEAGSSNAYIKEATIGSYTGQVIITGGTFNFDPTAYVAEGYVATKNGSTWTVSAE